MRLSEDQDSELVIIRETGEMRDDDGADAMIS